MSRMMADCRRWPSDTNCSLVMIGERDELLGAAVGHAVAVHGHTDSAELRDQMGQMLEPADQYQMERVPD